MKQLNPDDRPREKLIAHGPEVLSNAELLAILLGQGTRGMSALRIAERLTADQGLYKHLARCHRVSELAVHRGVGPAKAATILAALELGKRVACASAVETERLSSPRDGAQYLMGRLRNETHERFYVVLLNSKSRVMKVEQVAEGSLSSAVVHPREVFAPALSAHAAAILVAHNHPSGDPEPSRDDRELTQRLVQTGEIMAIPVMDHIIIGDGNYYSFQEHDELWP